MLLVVESADYSPYRKLISGRESPKLHPERIGRGVMDHLTVQRQGVFLVYQQ
jgi:hypothetical protein